MRALVVTNMYPSRGREHEGVFVRREVETLRRIRPDWDVHVVHIDTVRDSRRYITGVAEVSDAIARLRPDLVHAHYGLSGLLCRRWRGPFVLTLHGSDVAKPWQRPISRWAARRAWRTIAVSQTVRSNLGSDADIVPCGVDDRVFLISERRLAPQRRGVALSASPVVLFPASPRRRVKGYDLFLKSTDILRLRFPDLRLQTLETVHPDAVPDVLGAVDCVLMTSHREGSPVVTKEALCAGARVVSVDVGDVADQVRGFSGCRVVPSRSPMLLAEAVECALGEDPPASAEAMDRFSVTREASAIARIYEEVIESRCE